MSLLISSSVKKYIFFITLNFLVFKVYAQSIDFPQFEIDREEAKGKVILVNETHNIATNNLSYYLLIKAISKKFVDSDTLNIFIERPYSVSLMYNKILQNEDTLSMPKLSDFTQNKLPINAWLDSLGSLKKNIRFIGVDFEYDEGKRMKSYKCFFETLRISLLEDSVSIKELDNFIIKIDSKMVQNKDINELKKWLSVTPHQSKIVEDAIFILEAKHQFFGYRDRNNFDRFKQIIERRLDVKNQYNLLIYGSNHINPTRSKNLFNLFDRDEKSPFFNKTRLIANYYLDCTSYGFYNSKEPSKANEGLYELTGDEIVITELKKKNLNNAVSIFRNDLTLPLQSFGKILYFIVHTEKN